MVVSKRWEENRLPAKEENHVWEVFHENTKVGRYDKFLTEEEILDQMNKLSQSLLYEQYPARELPSERTPLALPLEDAIRLRSTARRIQPCPLTLEDLSTLLYSACGINRWNNSNAHPRPFRVVPSGGALYPLELYFYSKHVQGIDPGIYHYNPLDNKIRYLLEGDLTRELSRCLVFLQSNLASDTAILFFISAVFERTVFKYGSRGYRFIFLEAGHMAQNLNLAAVGLGLGSVNICGYHDRDVDELLGLDGLNQSTIYMVGIGKNDEDPFEGE